MKREYTIEDFKMNTYAYKPIVCDGYISSYSGKYEVNYSFILTALIQEAGRYCEYFASDLFIDWKSVEEFIDEAEAEEKKSFLFGFRQSGVDHDSFVFSRYNNSGSLAEYNYRSLWRLDVETKGNEIEMVLGRVF